MKSLFVFLFGLLAFSGCKNDSSLSASKPNIILILADDMSYYDISYLGQQKFTTPNIDALCNEGIVFNQAYSGAAECAPSRGSLMEGLHLGHSRVRLNASLRGQDYLIDDDITIAEALGSAGYKTGFVGKWGIGLPGTEGTPDKQGFDYSYGYYDQQRAHTFYPHYIMENGKQVPIPENYGFDMNKCYKHNGGTKGNNVYDMDGNLIPHGIEDPSSAKNSQDLIHEKGMKFIEDNKDEPFFLYYATQLPHGPCITPSLGEYADKPWDLKHKEWAAMMGHLDRHVGELIDHTKELGLADNTLILFASDNGYAMYGYFARKRWEDDPVFKNKGPWKGGKFGAYDGSVRVPMMAYWPGKIVPGESEHILALYDVMATACDLAGVNHIESDGLSFVPLLEGRLEDQEEHEFLYWGGGGYMRHAQAVRLGTWFGMRDSINGKIQLWDTEQDISSEIDLADKHPEIVEKMLAIMKEEHLESEWYINPGDSEETINAKRQQAIESGMIQRGIRGNSTYVKQ